MDMDISSSDFELFNLPQVFKQDEAVIDEHWRTLQREVHPDKFVHEGVGAQRLAMQYCVRVNEAYQRLRDPIKRAQYLCALMGKPLDTNSGATLSQNFLLQQMHWREQLQDAQNNMQLQLLENELKDAYSKALQHCEDALDRQHCPASAAQSIQAMVFIKKILKDIKIKGAYIGSDYH